MLIVKLLRFQGGTETLDVLPGLAISPSLLIKVKWRFFTWFCFLIYPLHLTEVLTMSQVENPASSNDRTHARPREVTTFI
jgi:hypothetical protein